MSGVTLFKRTLTTASFNPQTQGNKASGSAIASDQKSENNDPDTQDQFGEVDTVERRTGQRVGTAPVDELNAPLVAQPSERSQNRYRRPTRPAGGNDLR
jgi:hypothetical protein